MNKDKVHLILGSPGTGKTTKLVELLEQELETVPANRIAFVTFSRAAIREAAGRSIKKFDLTTQDLHYFRTLHSLALQSIGKTKRSVLTHKDIQKVGESVGVTLRYRGQGEIFVRQAQYTGGKIMTPDEAVYSVYELSRHKRISIEEAHALPRKYKANFMKLKLFTEALNAYKEENDKIDFFDMIELFNEEPLQIDIDVLFLDEAQDLDIEQWNMVEKLAENAKRVYIAGDDDQSIYSWRGADHSRFLSLDAGKVTVLNQSHRVPVCIAAQANRVIAQVTNRYEKTWKPADKEGTIVTNVELNRLDLSPATGTWLLLARHQYSLPTYDAYCRRMGYITNRQWNGKSNEDFYFRQALETIQIWDNLLMGNSVTVEEAIKVYLRIPKGKVQYGYKTSLKKLDPAEWLDIDRLEKEFGLRTREPWEEAFSFPHRHDKIIKARLKKHEEQGEDLTGKSRIIISTIHAVKGKEADNVVLNPRVLLSHNYEDNKDEEARLWYVGMTRAKKNLYILRQDDISHSYPFHKIFRASK